MKMTPQKAIDRILEKAPQTLKHFKHHDSVLFAFGEHESATVVIKFNDTNSKYSAMLTAGKKLAFLKPYCVAFVWESCINQELNT